MRGRRYGLAVAVAVLAVLPAVSAFADQGLTLSQIACVDRVDRRVRALAATHGAELRRCLKGASRDRVADAQACLLADGRGRLARGRQKLERAYDHDSCEIIPPYAYTGAATGSAAAEGLGLGIAADAFGADLGAPVAPVRSAEARCQALVARRATRLADRVLALWAARVGELIRRSRLDDKFALAEGLDALLLADEKGALARAGDKLEAGAVRRCAGLDLPALFPGVCASADPAGLAQCLAAAVRCGSCRAIETAGNVDLYCDPFDDGEINESCDGVPPGPGPALTGSVPAMGASGVSPHAWIALDYEAPLPSGAADLVSLSCAGQDQKFRLDVPAPSTLLVKPDLMLAPDAECALLYPAAADQGNAGLLLFSTGPEQPHVVVDRTHPEIRAPFPDDYFLVPDPNTPSGRRILVEDPAFGGLRLSAAQGVAQALSRWDGFSPISPILLVVSHALDPATLPGDTAASLLPDATLRLYDADPNSPDYGARLPFHVEQRNDTARDGSVDHMLIVYPALSLREAGRYVLAVTTGVRDLSGSPLVPSAFYAAAASVPDPADEAEVVRARQSIAASRAFLAQDASSPLAPAEIAASLQISVRSRFADPADWVAVKEQYLAAVPPLPEVTSSDVVGGDVIVRGTLPLPFYVLNPGFLEVARDGSGAPSAVGSDDVPFVLRYAQSATQPLPVVIYQHGSPGSPEEITRGFNDFLVDAGYALIGIQDVSNRHFGESVAEQLEANLTFLLVAGGLPLTGFQTNADQMGLVRAIEGMGVPGNFPELDPSRILYRGISFGAHHALGLLPFAPEIEAAAAVVGAGRIFHHNLHQLSRDDGSGTLLEGVLDAIPDARPRDVATAFAQLQHEADRNDGHLLARHLYREPVALSGLAGATPPSLLWIEGIGDSLVQNTATRAAAVELGIPTLRPLAGPSPVLDEVDGPVAGNLSDGATAAHFQYDPATTPSCVDVGQSEGHFCPQSADEAEAQTLHFFATALSGTAEILNPLP